MSKKTIKFKVARNVIILINNICKWTANCHFQSIATAGQMLPDMFGLSIDLVANAKEGESIALEGK